MQYVILFGVVSLIIAAVVFVIDWLIDDDGMDEWL